MIKIKVNDKVYGFEKEEIEGQFINAGVGKLNDAFDNMGAMKGTVKSSLNVLFMAMGINKPKELQDMDNVEFATRLAVETLLTSLEGQTIEIKAKEVQE